MAQTRAKPVATPTTSRCAWIGGALAGSEMGAGLALAVLTAVRMERAVGEAPSRAAGAAAAFCGEAIAAETPR